MKYIISTILIGLITLTHTAAAQENDSLAKKMFSMAESAYANGQYKDAVSDIKYAEIYSGGATSKSLYIKIRALDQLVNQDQSNLPALQSALDRFFEVTDKSAYPAEKYQEITSVMNRHKSGYTTTGNTAVPANTGKNAEEKADYEKAMKINTIDGYKEFLDKYSYTPHYGEIQIKYDELVKEEKEYNHHRPH